MNSSIKLNSRVRIKDNYYGHSVRGQVGTIISAPVANVFLGDVAIVKLSNGKQLSISSDTLELVNDKPVFRKGDKVKFKDSTPNSYWRGRTGIVLEDAYDSSLQGKVNLDILNSAHVCNLEFVERVFKEGEEIDLKDIVAGMEIKVTYTSGSENYTQTSTKQGVVKTVVKDGDTGDNIRLYAKDGDAVRVLSFDAPEEVFTLIKNAPKPDPITEALKSAKVGSVVQIEDDGIGKFVQTYIKSDPATNGTSRWFAIDSRYTSTSLISERTVRSKIQKLDQLVHTR